MVELSNNDVHGEIDDKYILHINNFEGSLDLLWHLIKKSKIDITEISISEITEQYIEYLKLMKKLNIKIASEFVSMASELLYYKSKALLPCADIEDEYFIPPLPPDLIQKLLEFKKFQLTSTNLRDNFENQSDFISRTNDNTNIVDDGEIAIEATLYDLIDVFVQLLDSGEFLNQEEIVFDEILVSDRISYITNLLKKKTQILFSEIFSQRPGIAEVIASFMAILEMSKSSMIKLMQNRVFGEIIILRQ